MTAITITAEERHRNTPPPRKRQLPWNIRAGAAAQGGPKPLPETDPAFYVDLAREAERNPLLRKFKEGRAAQLIEEMLWHYRSISGMGARQRCEAAFSQAVASLGFEDRREQRSLLDAKKCFRAAILAAIRSLKQ